MFFLCSSEEGNRYGGFRYIGSDARGQMVSLTGNGPCKRSFQRSHRQALRQRAFEHRARRPEGRSPRILARCIKACSRAARARDTRRAGAKSAKRALQEKGGRQSPHRNRGKRSCNGKHGAARSFGRAFFESWGWPNRATFSCTRRVSTSRLPARLKSTREGTYSW